MQNKSVNDQYDWKNVASSFYEKSLSLALLLLLFTFMVFPKIEVKPYQHKAKEIQTIEIPPEVRQKFKPPEEVKPIIPLTIEESDMGDDEDIEEIETIGPTTLDLTKPPPVSREGTTPKFVVHEEEPIPLKRVEPEYPQFALNAGIEGAVTIRAEIFEDGSVGAVEVVKSLQSGPGGLDEAAITAVKQWTFIPAKNQGKPVAVWVTFPVTFKL
ncbi:MAG TPA: energy transducer TonB [Candidatus Cloacimonetes bacterium]|nr:TonB family protein [Candidatus Cloacimonadota bacterium]HDO67933.1 energy transducer TonB [Candidatus Cloacimonadota bacterium]HEX37474.1 energy transducer TonB [Candidatus Cloacimonadota bacterium]